MVVPFIVRAQIVRDLGLGANGIYQVVYAMSSQYVFIAATAMTTYSYPKISQTSDVGEINAEVNRGIRALLLFTTSGILFVLLARDYLIRLLYTAAFLPAVPLFRFQMVGDLMRTMGWTLGLPLLPQERFRARIVLSTIQNVVFISVFFAFSAQSRLQGAVTAHLCAQTTIFLATLIYMGKVNGFRFTADSLHGFLKSLTAVVIVAFLPFPEAKFRLAALGVAVAWAATALTREDWRKLADAVRQRLASP
jgi:PST family polysaccharide transporter